ncbi:MAG: DMT family transporter [Hoeflea sp.]|uniref:DMT family transporter n=1 Tax=Hoeflea sp. TaxID=1940281 RepID=UPI00329A671B|tara:strand:+ start:5441 stop:6397 length:957 start_codon:yes stop_codon:yes gene_type:complete
MKSETSISDVAPLSGSSASAQAGGADARIGAGLVFGAALLWSFGGAIARGLEVIDPWTIIAWRSIFAVLFLIGFMLWRDGASGTLRLFRTMGLPGLGVALCVAAATTSFVVALNYTSVANILLMQAGVPLIAALLGVVFLREAVDGVTWAAIVAVIAGIGVMVSDSFAASVSFVGDGLALLIAVVFAAATVITRRYSGVRMTPAACLGIMTSGAVGLLLSSGLRVSPADLGLLVLFGAFTLGFGMAMFVTGARLLPSALAALISTMEPVLGPVWVWLIHAEVPAPRTLMGGGVVFVALVGHILWQWRLSRRTALPLPN